MPTFANRKGDEFIKAMIDRASVDAFVEKNADYYFEKWTAFTDDSASRVQWNWAAAFAGVVWLLYRKLYVPMAIAMAVVIVDAHVTVELEDAGVFPVAVATWDKISYWIYAAVFGSWGNYWYYQKFRKANNELLGFTAESQERFTGLAERGGTNLVVAGIFLILFAALMFWAVTDV